MKRYVRAAAVCITFLILLAALIFSIVSGGFNHPCLASHVVVSYRTEYDGKNNFIIVPVYTRVCDRRG